MKILICFVGVIVAVLSITGVIIWLKKRRARYSEKNFLRKNTTEKPKEILTSTIVLKQ